MRAVTVGLLLGTVGLTLHLAGGPVLGQELGTAPACEARGIWITLSLALKKQTVPEIVAQLREHNLNLAFMLHQSDQAEAMREFAQACRDNGIEVHVWVTPRTLVPDPPEELHIHGYNYKKKEFTRGRPGFFLPEYRQAAAQRAAELMRELPVDGIHLDGVRYGLPWDNLGPETVAQFARDAGVEVKDYRTDIIIVDKVTSKNIGNPREWAGRYLGQWRAWRCRVLADLFADISRAVKAVSPKLAVSNAVMSDSASPLYYGVDYGLLAPHLDLFAPMTYYNRYGKNAKWAIRRCREIAIKAQAANPNCRVYAGVATYSHSRCRTWILNIIREAQKAGRLTKEQVADNHLREYLTGADMLRSATWLYGHDIIAAPTYERMLNAIITDEEILQAIELMRAGRDVSLPEADEYVGEAPVEGIVFFRYFCMFPGNTEGVVGNLWDKLRPVFAKPAALPNRQGEQ